MNYIVFRKLILSCIFILPVSFVIAQTDSVSVKILQRKEAQEKKWVRLMPRYGKLQIAGSMGLVSIGTGWDYGKKKQMETDVFLGYVPKFTTNTHKITLTLKQNFIPWNLPIRNTKLAWEPLTVGGYINTVFGNEFWVSEPERYPGSYYSFSSKLRLSLFAGQRVSYNITHWNTIYKTATFFYEWSTYDLNIRKAVMNKYLKMEDYISLSVGLKLQAH